MVGMNKVLSAGHFQGGSHTNILVINQIGIPYKRNGRLLPKRPGLLLSVLTPNIIEDTAETIRLIEIPTEVRIASKFTV